MLPLGNFVDGVALVVVVFCFDSVAMGRWLLPPATLEVFVVAEPSELLEIVDGPFVAFNGFPPGLSADTAGARTTLPKTLRAEIPGNTAD
jgi:hypothetical protein